MAKTRKKKTPPPKPNPIQIMVLYNQAKKVVGVNIGFPEKLTEYLDSTTNGEDVKTWETFLPGEIKKK